MEKTNRMRTFARALRKNATREEKHLWYDFLASYPVRFRRQVSFGSYIVDFYCPQAKLAVELDGSQHYEGVGPSYDETRTRRLNEVYHLHILRFTNLDIKQNFEGVCLEIDRAVQKRLPPSVMGEAHDSSPQGEPF